VRAFRNSIIAGMLAVFGRGEGFGLTIHTPLTIFYSLIFSPIYILYIHSCRPPATWYWNVLRHSSRWRL